MAFFDNFTNPMDNEANALAAQVNPSSGGFFDGMNVFGTSIPTGILDSAQEEKLRKQALTQGLLGTLATYVATPKNLGAGSALPYLGKAYLGGMGASQDVVDRTLNNAYRQQLLAGRGDNLYNVDGALVDKTGKVVYQGTPKQDKLPTSRQEFDLAAQDPAYMKFLREKWDAENKALKASAQVEESAYKYGTPQQSISVNAGGKTYYFKDQNSANLFRQKAGIK
jgi:YHS domain-containing protein